MVDMIDIFGVVAWFVYEFACLAELVDEDMNFLSWMGLMD